MDEVHYYSKAFPMVIDPNFKVFEYKNRDFQKALDTLFCLADLNNKKLFWMKPMNILVAKTKDKLILGINFDKAIYGFTSLNTIQKNIPDEKIEKFMRQVYLNELGLNINCFVKFNLEAFCNSFDTLVSQFDFNAKANDNKQMHVYSKDITECLLRLDEGMKQSSSIYGGNGMWVDPIFKARDITVDPNMCFCVLPFNEIRLTLLEKIIKPKLEDEFGITVIKSGDIFHPNENIMENIWNYINQASFIIADISDKNPNVFYELGICHTIGKKVITLCDQESYEEDYKEKLPFDISSLNTIFYRKDLDGPQELINKLIDYIKLMRPEESHLNN